MTKTSVIIPARNELFLAQTVDDIFKKATQEIEIIVCLDGYWPVPILPDNPNLILVHSGISRGMRWGINAAANIAKGEYLMKTDAHCMFAEGFDEVLQADCDDNWIVIPRRYSLDAELWERKPKTPIDYHYLDCPFTNKEFFQFHGMIWPEKAGERSAPEYDIDDIMSWQGSMWFMHKDHFHKHLKGLSEEGYGTFSQEPQEIGNKTWLGGGAIKVNKKTWYAHLHKGKQYGRMYSISGSMIRSGHEYSAHYWMQNKWPE
jgi:glycosyltransferase involved in cell wall biosynthesis